MTATWTIEDLYLRRGIWEYSQAFDLAAAALARADGPALVVSSSAVHAVELLKRCSVPLDMAGTGSFDPYEFAALAQPWSWGPIRAVRLPGDAGPYAAMLWAEPEAASATTVARALRQVAAPAATLDVIASAPLRRYLPLWQVQPLPARQPLTPAAARRRLEAAGWQVQRQVALHGPRAIAWARLSQFAEALGRSDWADRFLFAVRRQYCEAGWCWPLAPLTWMRVRLNSAGGAV